MDMTTKTKCDCKTNGGLCHYDALTRTKFFNGMLLTDEHLRAEQTYHRESLKRLNRSLWGAGIVCGLEVRKLNKKETGLCIKVEPGMALDCAGNVIDVCKSLTIDLSQVCKEAYPDGCAPEDVKPITKFLVIRYAEIAADPQPVLTPDDECGPPGGGTKCEGSKYREGFCLEFRDECPNCPPCGEKEEEEKDGVVSTFLKLQHSTKDDDEVEGEMEKRKPDCMDSPPCSTCDCDCDDAAVGLAKVVIDCDKNTVEVDTDKCDCRQYVWSPRLLQWLICRLLGNIHTVRPGITGLKNFVPTSGSFASNPLNAAWKVSAAALRAPRSKGLYRDVEEIKAQLAKIESVIGPKLKNKP
jgi:hypothetical protein